MKKIKLEIKDMHCTSCAMNIDFDLEDFEGVSSCKTSYTKAIAEVEFDEEEIEVEKILEQVQKTGYSATVKNE